MGCWGARCLAPPRRVKHPGLRSELRLRSTSRQIPNAQTARANLSNGRISLPSFTYPSAVRPWKLTVSSAAVVLLTLTACQEESPSSGSSSSTKKADEQRFGAFEICKDFVKDRLKAPSTAKFRNFFQDDGEVVVTGSGNGPYTVTSSVDSQNSFGANLRSNFVCKVTNTSGDSWHLDNISIAEQ